VEVGAKRVMEVKERANEERVETVKAVDTKDGMTIVTLDRQADGRELPPEVLGASDTGLFRLASDGKKLDPPHRILRLPARPGDKWEIRVPGETLRLTHTNEYEMGSEEEVTTPAGKFRAVRVHRKSIRGDGRVSMDLDLWIAPNVGVVKVAGKLDGEDHEQVLKSFTPAPKK